MNTVETTTNTEIEPVVTLDELEVVATVTAPWVDRFEGLEDCGWEYEEYEDAE